MPDKEDILRGLHNIANNYKQFAIAWHIIFYLFAAILILLRQPTDKILAIALCLPVLSVALFALVSGNPFNGLLFSVLAVLTIIFAFKASDNTVVLSNGPFMIIGILMIIFGLVYPHFLFTGSFIKYLYASPAGLIPCPTLSIIIGLLLVFNGAGSQPLTLIFALSGLFYGIFGVLKLAVRIDIVLIFGAASLLIKYFF